MLDLNGAFAEGGFVLEIAPGGRVDAMFELVALDGATGAQGRFGRAMVIVGENSRATFLETRGESGEGFSRQRDFPVARARRRTGLRLPQF